MISKMAHAPFKSEMRAQSNLKRKRQELEIFKLETDIRCKERESLIAISKHYESLCGDTKMDERAKRIFKESILMTLST